MFSRAQLLNQRLQTPQQHSRARPEKLNSMKVVKRLNAGLPGTARWLDRFGEDLLCVRYREDPATGERYTTVELIVAMRGPKPGTKMLVKIDYRESELRRRVRQHGGDWDSVRRLWRVPYEAVLALGLEERGIEKLPSMETRG